MDKVNRVVLNIIFCVQVLLLFLLFVEDKIHLPAWLQVAGRMHPLVLHLPIGIMIFLVVLLLVQKQFDKAATRQIIHIGLLLTSLSASFAALFGFFLSLQSDYGTDVLMRHKVSGVMLSCLCYVAVLWFNSNKKQSVFIALGIVSCLALVFTGHTGSVLTHGDNFLLAPISKPEVILTAENASVYKFAVEPILERKCFSCHNESKAKGKLVMTSIEKFIAGGENGKPWIEGNPSDSRMIKSFYLPLSHDEHMPPDGKPQLTQLEIATLKAWIKSGADFEKKLAQLPDGDSLKFMVASMAASKPVLPVEERYTFSAASDGAVAKLNTPFRTVFPLYQNSPALQADFFVKKSFEVKALEELKAIEDQLVVLNLSKMPITDKDLSIIKTFKNLEHLNINFSSIQGPGLKELESLKNLKSISLSGTSVGVNDISPLLKLPQLKELYLWSTKITSVQADSLAKIYPTILILDSQFKDDSRLKLNKPMLVNEGVIKRDEEVMLKHPMPGVTIRYTLDGSEPDTAKSAVFDKPMRFTETAVIKARACKDAWYCSDVFEVTCFVEGIKPTHLELLSPADPQYPGEGVQSLTDGRKGVADVTKEPSWLGYRNNPFVVGFSFQGQAPMLKKIALSYGKNLGGYIFPPEEIEVWAGENADKLKLIKKVKPDQPKGYDAQKVESLSLSLEPAAYHYYKLIAKPVAKLPLWHSGKGDKGWVFVDEMFFY
jgi:uncharacterized membrane protein